MTPGDAAGLLGKQVSANIKGERPRARGAWDLGVGVWWRCPVTVLPRVLRCSASRSASCGMATAATGCDARQAAAGRMCGTVDGEQDVHVRVF